MAMKGIKEIRISEEMESAYLDYAMSVIISRALPDARDGLKPVHRRILYTMHTMGLGKGAPYRKSARIVGECLGKYHPHGDVAVYEAMARMAQDFSMRYPLVDGQGNFGSVDGDPPAAMRYTEARLTPLAMEMLADIGKDTVDFVDNFDGSLKEPTVLPSRIPNLLVNGASGIAVGMSTNIPPHNLREVCDALLYLIDHYDEVQKVTIDELMRYIKGPDFPTGGIVYRRHGDKKTDAIRRAYATGKGHIVVQAKTHIEEMTRGRNRIVITELPYQVNKRRLIERIAYLARKGEVEGITDLRDESGREGMRVVIELARTAEPKRVLAELFKLTQMRVTFNVITLALVNGEPRLLPLKRALLCYLDHRFEVLTRRTRYELKRANERAHILEGLLVALSKLDEVIAIIRHSRSSRTAAKNLKRKFKLTDVQAEAILAMPLGRLSSTDRAKVEKEYKEVSRRIKILSDLLAHPRKILGLMKKDLEAIKERYGDERRTMILEEEKELVEEATIPEENLMVVLTMEHVWREKAASFSFYQRYGLTTRAVDAHLVHLLAHPLDDLLFVTNLGRGFKYKAFRLPPRKESTKTFLGLEEGERVISIVNISEEGKPLVLVSSGGYVKRITPSALNLREGAGTTIFGLKEGDKLVFAGSSLGGEIMLATRLGQAIRFPEGDVRLQLSRYAQGVAGIKLGEGDIVVGASLIPPTPDLKGDFLTVSEKGFLKRTLLTEYPVQSRYSKGVRAAHLTEKTGKLAACALVEDGDNVSVISEGGRRAFISVLEVPRQSRRTQGELLADFGADERVALAVAF